MLVDSSGGSWSIPIIDSDGFFVDPYSSSRRIPVVDPCSGSWFNKEIKIKFPTRKLHFPNRIKQFQIKKVVIFFSERLEIVQNYWNWFIVLQSFVFRSEIIWICLKLVFVTCWNLLKIALSRSFCTSSSFLSIKINQRFWMVLITFCQHMQPPIWKFRCLVSAPLTTRLSVLPVCTHIDPHSRYKWNWIPEIKEE